MASRMGMTSQQALAQLDYAKKKHAHCLLDFGEALKSLPEERLFTNTEREGKVNFVKSLHFNTKVSFLLAGRSITPANHTSWRVRRPLTPLEIIFLVHRNRFLFTPQNILDDAESRFPVFIPVSFPNDKPFFCSLVSLPEAICRSWLQDKCKFSNIWFGCIVCYEAVQLMTGLTSGRYKATCFV